MKYIHMGRIEVLDIQRIERRSFDLWRLCIFEMKRDLFKTARPASSLIVVEIPLLWTSSTYVEVRE